MRTRWLVLAGAILALQAPALNVIAHRLFDSGYLSGREPFGLRVSSAVREYEWIRETPLEVRMAPMLAAHVFLCGTLILGAFGRTRRVPAVRVLTLSFALLVAFALAVRWLHASPEGIYWKTASALLGLAFTMVVAAQAAIGTREGTPAATSRAFFGLLLIIEGLADATSWGFSPWLLGGWAAVAGGALIVPGEWRGLCEPDSSKRAGRAVV